MSYVNFLNELIVDGSIIQYQINWIIIDLNGGIIKLVIKNVMMMEVFICNFEGEIVYYGNGLGWCKLKSMLD